MDLPPSQQVRPVRPACIRCHHYNNSDAKFTTEYKWKHCKDMKVGETYEVHWPHSAAGACNTPNQYQTPFYDGVFCRDDIISLKPLNCVQAQVLIAKNVAKSVLIALPKFLVLIAGEGESAPNMILNFHSSFRFKSS